MGGSSGTMKKPDAAQEQQQAAQQMAYFLPFLGASGLPQQPVSTQPGADQAGAAGGNDRVSDLRAWREKMGLLGDGTWKGDQRVVSRTSGLNGPMQYGGQLFHRGKKRSSQGAGGANNAAMEQLLANYDAGPMQAALAQQLQAGYGGLLSNYENQLSSLYRPMQIGSAPVPQGADEEKKKTGLTGLLGVNGGLR